MADSLPELADSLLNIYHQWFEPLKSRRIPPIPVGVIDSVVIPAHEGYLSGNAAYFWSPDGWSNDWVHMLDPEGSSISWPLEITREGMYRCYVNYTCKTGGASLYLQFTERQVSKELPPYTPEPDRNYSRIDRSAEAIGQTWNRMDLGEYSLVKGPDRLTITASEPELQLLSVVLVRK
jgi:hypothetical protein